MVEVTITETEINLTVTENQVQVTTTETPVNIDVSNNQIIVEPSETTVNITIVENIVEVNPVVEEITIGVLDPEAIQLHKQLFDMPDLPGVNADHDGRYYTKIFIDVHFDDDAIHFTEDSIDHGSIDGLNDVEDHPGFLVIDGIRELTDNWDAGDFTIEATTFDAQTVTGSPGVGIDIDGVDLIIKGGTSTGTGDGGSIIMQFTPAGSSGNTPNAVQQVFEYKAEAGIEPQQARWKNTQFVIEGASIAEGLRFDEPDGNDWVFHPETGNGTELILTAQSFSEAKFILRNTLNANTTFEAGNIRLVADTNQIVLDSDATNTLTINASSMTAARTASFPDQTGNFVLTPTAFDFQLNDDIKIIYGDAGEVSTRFDSASGDLQTDIESGNPDWNINIKLFVQNDIDAFSRFGPSPTHINENNTRDRLICVKKKDNLLQAAGASRALLAVQEFTDTSGGSISNGNFMALNAFAYTTNASTSGNARSIQQGGCVGGRYAFRHQGSGTITRGGGVASRAAVQGDSDGDITEAYAYLCEGITGGTGSGLITDAMELWILADSGNITNSYGIRIEERTAGSIINREIFLEGGGEIFFRDGDLSIGSSTDGQLDLKADETINTNAGRKRRLTTITGNYTLLVNDDRVEATISSAVTVTLIDPTTNIDQEFRFINHIDSTEDLSFDLDINGVSSPFISPGDSIVIYSNGTEYLLGG